VGVAHKRPDYIGNFIFNWSVQSSAGNPVAVNNLLFSVWRLKSLVDANDIFSEIFEVFFKMDHKNKFNCGTN
jgi:hypothetical protein